MTVVLSNKDALFCITALERADHATIEQRLEAADKLRAALKCDEKSLPKVYVELACQLIRRTVRPHDLLGKQEPLGAEFEKVLYDNLDSLYSRTGQVQPAQGDSYESVLNAIQHIEASIVCLPTFEVVHEGGIEACAKNIVQAITKAAALLQSNAERVPLNTMCDEHPSVPAVSRIQGETDSIGSEQRDMCQVCRSCIKRDNERAQKEPEEGWEGDDD